MRTNLSSRLRELAVPFFGVLGVLFVAWEGRRDIGPPPWARGQLSEQGYPYVGVAVFAGVIALESLAVWKILRPRSYVRSWSRAGAGLVTVVAFVCFWTLWHSHVPHFFRAHVAWLAIMALLLLFLAIVSVAASLAWRITGGSSGPA